MSHLFEPAQVHEIGRQALGLPFDDMVTTVTSQLEQAAPGHLLPRREWIYSVTAGVTGIMSVLHASLEEYVLIFGTPIGSEGFSGRYHIDIWDVVLAGEMSTFHEERPGERVRSEPGQMTLLPRGHVKGASFVPGTWLLEYARGPIATCLPMALGDLVFSALDGTTLYKTLQVYGRGVLRELLRGRRGAARRTYRQEERR